MRHDWYTVTKNSMSWRILTHVQKEQIIMGVLGKHTICGTIGTFSQKQNNHTITRKLRASSFHGV